MIAVAEAQHLELRTPEHVPIGFVLADLGSRFGALVIDIGIVLLGLIVVVLVAGLFLFASAGDQTLAAFALLVIFLWRNFYFTASEIYGQGRTLGKRLMRLRVVARDGGPLRAEQIFARNLTRDLEIFLPLTLLLAPESLVPGAPWWVQAATVVWIVVLALLPFGNRQKARLGDLLAGTVVVVEPTGELLEDLLARNGRRRSDRTAEYSFTREQLDIYGIHELQVLEEVLRRSPSDDQPHLLRTICAKVRNKIDWDRSAQVEPRAFLEAFYAAQRHRLEQKMLFGKRQERKVR